MANPIIEPEPPFIRPRIPDTIFYSPTDLGLNQVPHVNEQDDPILYQELQDIHNAIETLRQDTARSEEDVQQVIDKSLRTTLIDEDYQVVITDGTIRVDAAGGDINVTLPLSTAAVGAVYDVKRIDLAPANTVIILGSGVELIDDRVDGIKVSTKSSYTVKATPDNGYDII